LEITSSFFCTSPCTLSLPALPSTPARLPLPMAIEIALQARETTSISRRRSGK
jgi:hypothetical protein